MSGKAAAEGPKPQAPKTFKGKVKVTVALDPRVEPPQVADLTVLPSSSVPRPEDSGPAPRYEAVAQRRGMFSAAERAAGAGPPGRKPERRALSVAERLARPLMASDSNEESEGEEEVVAAAAAEAAPPPPPPKPVVPLPAPVSAKPALPRVAKEFLGLAAPSVEKKSYTEAAVKRRFTDEIADTLMELQEQLEALKITGLDLDEGIGYTADPELIEGKTKYVFDNNQQFEENPKISDAKLAALDDLFPSLRIRMNHILGEGRFETGSTDPIARDYMMLLKLMAYAPKFKKDKPKLLEKERALALKDMLTNDTATTLLELEENLDALHTAGLGIQSIKETKPTVPGQPTVYELPPGNTFLEVTAAPDSRIQQENRLKALDFFFAGGMKVRLTTVSGVGAYNEEGSPLAVDLQTLQQLFGFAKEFKERAAVVRTKAEAAAAAVEADRTKTLVGTEYESLAKPIEAEMTKSPYEVTTDSKYTPGLWKDRRGANAKLPEQKGFIPQTRRAFSYFIYDKYRQYMLKAMEKLDPNACKLLGDSANVTQIYEYQKFVRDYISYMTPYRGVLVYHGLGSGKTCTAIAASEALLSSGGKKRIIVMTPFSLRKNFIQQITFCGFRHYRLLNYWTAHTYKASDGRNALWLFATSVMRIPESYLMARRGALRIWIPDLAKPQSAQNYTSLGAVEQGEIRNQIYETLVYDPDKGKNGLIWFINYNGITATKLKDLACKAPYDAFDNSVIVIDEIHNLVRLMQGTIDPYLKKITMGEIEAESKGDAKYLDPDRISSAKWHPKYCNKTKNYKRGYLFYRLLTEARNTKIVGLSGTPLINFPEELGILANVLHGYNFVFTASIPKISEPNGNKTIQEELKKMAEGLSKENFCPDIDYYEVTPNDRQSTIDFQFTFLPEGYQKIPGQLGVERIPFTDPLLTTEEKLQRVRGCITKILKAINPVYQFTRQFKEKAEPLLPVMGEPSIPEAKQLDDSFKGRFVNPDGIGIVNEQILLKRLNGLISYYKGSRKDLMPEVIEDAIVRIPMSLEQQKKYIDIRLGEIEVEEKKAERKGMGPPEGRGDDVELQKLSSSQNYRMASRQACNFVFPDGFVRPRPLTVEQARQANEFGGQVEDMIGDDQAVEESALVGSPDEERAASEKERRDAEEAAQDDQRVMSQQEEEEVEAKKNELRGKPPGEIDAAVKAIRERYAEQRRGGLLLASAEEREAPEPGLSEDQKRCLTNMLPNETYQDAINRSKECLLKYGLPKLALVDPEDPRRPSPLGRCSPKYKSILEHIEGLPGSSLVYSQFLGMEGIGIFTIAMQANGYTPIRIEYVGGSYMFDKRTEESIRKGPQDKNEKRFILFTGGEKEEVRKINIDIFNAKFSELPPEIARVLFESGFTDEIGNKRGELCRVFCITAAGAEGLSLKNVRGVHIMEPYWNDVRMAQVKGRAVRICSHQELPLKDRNVRIYTYITVFDRLAQESMGDPRENERMKWAIPQEIWNRDFMDRATAEKFGLRVAESKGEYAMTSDERLYYISEKKKKLVENLTVIMKTAAADCLLNYEENRDGTFICRLLGNEGDFLYHPNLQKDIETSKRDNIGDLFKVPAEELARIKAANAKLRFEEEEEAAAEAPAAPEAPAVAVPEAPVAPAAAPAAAAAPAPAPAAPVAAPKRISYPVKIADKQYVVSALPDDKGKVAKFYVYAGTDTAFATALGQADAVFDAAKKRWIPKAGTVKFN